jgi:Fur family ferric uptake transcriptional regulator
MRTILVRNDRYRRDAVATTQRAVLTDLGLRPTAQRLAVLEVLASDPNGATAQEIHDRLRAGGSRVGLATVYRTLAALTEGGAVDALAHRPGEACYRLCGSGHHHHLVCERCNRVVELGECDLEPWLARLGDTHGFEVTRHSVEVAGLCEGCRRSKF